MTTVTQNQAHIANNKNYNSEFCRFLALFKLSVKLKKKTHHKSNYFISEVNNLGGIPGHIGFILGSIHVYFGRIHPHGVYVCMYIYIYTYIIYVYYHMYIYIYIL